MKWMEISVAVRREDIEAVCAVYDEAGTGGVVIEDPALIYDLVAGGSSETVAVGAPPDPGSPPVVKGYLPADGLFPEKLEGLRRGLSLVDPEYAGRVTLEEIEESSWMDRWREYYRPVRIGRKLLVKPSWLPVEPEDGLLVIEMDPGMAFGCGTHPTTAMCMTLLEEVIGGGEAVLDVGTGSGILSITAAGLGAASVLAVDSDPVAVRVARENVEANGMTHLIAVREGDLLEGVRTPADVIAANITADVIIRLLPSAAALLKGGGKFIASGVIAGRREEVAGAIKEAGLEIIKTVLDGEWAAFLAIKPGHRGQNTGDRIRSFEIRHPCR
ncbi:MAG: 50S ribosomal protein L11 methyltransferase [Peptococcaceae bacterium]|nr:50S ribosomal protein L11 methyltransferase [Peptococcaceae bacterium]